MSFLDIFTELGPAIAIASPVISQIEAAASSLASGAPVQVPEIRTYIAGKHLAIDVTIKELPTTTAS